MSDAARGAFDAAATSYDADFTNSLIGRLQREQLWRIYERLFRSEGRLLDLGCGTGEDLLRFARRGAEVEGVDLSPEMVAIAERRIVDAGLEEHAAAVALGLERLGELPERGFDGAYSSFSPLNCVADLRPVAAALAERLKPGAPVALCLMNRFCLWETLFYPLTLQLHKAARRWGGGWAAASVGQEDFRIRYHRLRDVEEAFRPWFELEAAPGVGVFVPPTYLEPLAQRFPRLMRLFDRLDRVVGAWPGFRAAGDHRVIVLRKKS